MSICHDVEDPYWLLWGLLIVSILVDMLIRHIIFVSRPVESDPATKHTHSQRDFDSDEQEQTNIENHKLLDDRSSLISSAKDKNRKDWKMRLFQVKIGISIILDIAIFAYYTWITEVCQF